MDHLLTAEERDQLDRDGYVLRRNVFGTDEVAAMIAACEDLVSRLVARRTGQRQVFGSYVFAREDDMDTIIKWEGDTDIVHGIEPFAHLSPELERWAMDERFLGPMVEVCGDPAPILFTEKLNLKRPRHGGQNPLHQDYPYWERWAKDAHRIGTAMLFLDDSSMENGTLQVLPGSHTQGKWAQRGDKDDFGNLELDPATEEGKTIVPIEVEAGSVVFFGAFLVHKSNPNLSDRERRTLLYSYQPGGNPHGRFQLRRSRNDETDTVPGTTSAGRVEVAS